jgi:hypothetical protein
VLPSVGGVPMDRLDAWWSSHREFVSASVAPFAAEVVTPGTVQARPPAARPPAAGAAPARGPRTACAWAATRRRVLPPPTQTCARPPTFPPQVGRRDAVGVLVSAKEEADLEELLGMFALGLGEPEEFAARLQVGFPTGQSARGLCFNAWPAQPEPRLT